MFLQDLAGGDKTFKANLKKLWLADVDTVKVKALTNIPWTEVLPKSLTFGNLVFHAMGSKINPKANVLFNKEVNNMKEGVWTKSKLVKDDKYKALFEGVAQGKTDSAKLHSVHRNVGDIGSHCPRSTRITNFRYSQCLTICKTRM
jgi:hypothetical protein